MAVINNDIYNRVAATWWEEDGFMALLRESVNPPRFQYFAQVLQDRKLDPQDLSLLDVGCGGGLLAERFAGLGCRVTGVDPSGPTLEAARAHAEKSSLNITYVEGTGENIPLAAASFDIACCCDVLEHVDSPDAVIAEIARVLKPGGLFFFDTINRTLKSRLVAIKLAQDWPLTRLLPRHVHVYEKFIRPDELTTLLNRHRLHAGELTGLAPTSPLRAIIPLLRHKLGRSTFAELGRALPLRQGKDLSISYMGYARRAG